MPRPGSGYLFRNREPALSVSVEEERDLARRSQAGDREASDRLLRAHLAFIVSIARKYRRYGVPMNDLVQEGSIGLLHAIRKFDPSAGARLSTYARWWVRAAIQDHVVRSWSLVRIGTTAGAKGDVLPPAPQDGRVSGRGRGDDRGQAAPGRAPVRRAAQGGDGARPARGGEGLVAQPAHAGRRARRMGRPAGLRAGKPGRRRGRRERRTVPPRPSSPKRSSR